MMSKRAIQLAGSTPTGKKFRDAAIQFGQAIKLRPDDADLQTNLGTSLTFAGDLTAAIGAFERALALKRTTLWRVRIGAGASNSEQGEVAKSVTVPG